MNLRAYAQLDSEDPRRAQFAEQLANSVGAQFLQGHQFVRSGSSGGVELRGRWNDLPVRLQFGLSFADFEWEMKATNPAGADLQLMWNPGAVPDVGQFSGALGDDWGGTSEAKVFFAKGYYLKAKGHELDHSLAAYQSLPDHVRNALLTCMVNDQSHHLYVYDNGRMLLDQFNTVVDAADPLNKLGRGVWLLGQLAWGLAQLDPGKLPPRSAAAAPGLLAKMTCGYCSTLYLWSQNQVCPNCGAPPRAR